MLMLLLFAIVAWGAPPTLGSVGECDPRLGGEWSPDRFAWLAEPDVAAPDAPFLHASCVAVVDTGNRLICGIPTCVALARVAPDRAVGVLGRGGDAYAREAIAATIANDAERLRSAVEAARDLPEHEAILAVSSLQVFVPSARPDLAPIAEGLRAWAQGLPSGGALHGEVLALAATIEAPPETYSSVLRNRLFSSAPRPNLDTWIQVHDRLTGRTHRITTHGWVLEKTPSREFSVARPEPLAEDALRRIVIAIEDSGVMDEPPSEIPRHDRPPSGAPADARYVVLHVLRDGDWQVLALEGTTASFESFGAAGEVLRVIDAEVGGS